MRTFKLIDLVVQAALILFFLLFWLEWMDFDTAIYGYFMVGGWQATPSRAISARSMRGWSHRKIHTLAMLLLPMGALYSLITPGMGMVLAVAMLFASPLLAIWYWLLCYQEWRRLKRRTVAVVGAAAI